MLLNDERRTAFKNQLINGHFTPWEYLEAISNTIGKNVNDFAYPEDCNYSDNSEDFSDTDNLEVEDNSESTRSHNCVICLNPRTSTWIFLPCRHANCCGECSDKIEELGQTCPTCRSSIVDRFQIYNLFHHSIFIQIFTSLFFIHLIPYFLKSSRTNANSPNSH